ncbi:ABC transporter substrate-binding protein [Neobacillus pocheonensis]|uniref:ABC transporter substrate-binding protein n=1 Tax=Neobacillus pocheonensis TaxID=363869 RepID=UPI003D2C8761
MKQKIGRKLLYLFFTLVVIISAGCSDNSSTKTNGSNSSTPMDGGTVTLSIAADPIFNPFHPNAFVESVFINRVLFSGLTKPGKDLSPAPDLATSWEPSEDGLSWTFHLREGVKWHDGKPFTAEDVAYTFNNIVLDKKLAASGASIYSGVKQVEVKDAKTVVFQLDRPMAALPAYLGYNSGILPKHIFEGKDPWNLTSFNKEKPIGTGPFKIGKYLAGQQVELVANPDYYAGKPHLDKLVYKVIADGNSQVAQALSNELSIMILDSNASTDRIKQAGNLTINPVNVTRFYWISLNQKDPRFTDVRVRRAFMHAIDRESIIKTVEKGYAQIANSPISPSLENYYKKDVSGYDYDPNKAKKLLAEAGWKDTNGDGILDKDGKPFSFNFDIGIKGDLEPVSQMVQQYLKAVGIDVKLNTMEWNAMIQKNIVKRDYDMILNWWIYPSDPDVLPYFHSSTAEKGYNLPGFKDQKLDNLLELGQKTIDPKERQKVYFDLQDYMSEQLPYLFLWYPQEIQIRNKNLQGVPELGLRDAMHYVNEWWIKQ